MLMALLVKSEANLSDSGRTAKGKGKNLHNAVENRERASLFDSGRNAKGKDERLRNRLRKVVENRERVINYWMGDNRKNFKKAKPLDLTVDLKTSDADQGQGQGKGLLRKGGRDLQDLVNEGPWEDGGDILHAAGRLMFMINGAGYICSATAVTDEGTPGRSIILTAAHCVHEGNGGPVS